MTFILRKKKDQQQEAPPEAAQEAPEDNRLLLFTPDGSFTYRLAAFPSVKSAAEYADSQLLAGQTFLSFWALESEPPPGARRESEPAGEAMIMVRDPRRADIVQLYSFVDMDTAQSFLRQEIDAGLDGARAVSFWAEPVTIPRGLTSAPASPPPPAESAKRFAPAPVAAATASTSVAAPSVPPDSGERKGPAIGGGVMTSRFGELTARIQAWPGWDGLVPRMIAASMLKENVYEEAVERDPNATGRAGFIVVVGALAAAIGAFGAGPFVPVWHFVFALCGWWAYAGIVYFTATRLLEGVRPPPDAYRRVLSALGLAHTPAIFLALGLIPVYGPLLTLGVLIWLLVTGIVAVGAALELDRQSAAMATAAGWLFLFAVTLIGPLMFA